MKGLSIRFWDAIEDYSELISGEPVRFFNSPPKAGGPMFIELSADLSILIPTFGKGSEPYMGDTIEFPTIALKGI